MIVFNHEAIATDCCCVPCVNKKSWLMKNFIPYFYERYFHADTRKQKFYVKASVS